MDEIDRIENLSESDLTLEVYFASGWRWTKSEETRSWALEKETQLPTEGVKSEAIIQNYLADVTLDLMRLIELELSPHDWLIYEANLCKLILEPRRSKSKWWDVTKRDLLLATARQKAIAYLSLKKSNEKNRSK